MMYSKTPFCCSKFPWARERISPKITDNFGKRSVNGSPALTQDVNYVDLAQYRDQ
jgi:hypothetical protein